MENIVIAVENPFDTELILSLVARLGLKARTLSALEQQLLARQALVKLSKKNNQDVDMSEIMSAVEAVRSERYAS